MAHSLAVPSLATASIELPIHHPDDRRDFVLQAEGFELANINPEMTIIPLPETEITRES